MKQLMLIFALIAMFLSVTVSAQATPEAAPVRSNGSPLDRLIPSGTVFGPVLGMNGSWISA